MKTAHGKTCLPLLLLLLMPALILAQGIKLDAGIRAVAQGTIKLVIDSGGLKNEGVFTAANSHVIFAGAGTTAISGSQAITFYDLSFQGSGTKLNDGNASVIRTLAVTGTTVLDADGAGNTKSFTLKSSDTATANVDVLTTGNIIGNVTVERFINTGTNPGQHAKSWQFLATPTTGQTYFQSWQESGLTPAGFGTWLTGTGTGFDVTTVLPSVKFYNEPGANWTGVTNTGNQLQNKLGYMLFVRGDRTVTTFNGTPNQTNMRSKGVLFTAINPPPSITVPANRFQTFGNPYASRIEFSKVLLASPGIKDLFYVWDPKLNGYQALSGLTGYVPSSGGPLIYYPAGVASPFIESGQAVFVQGNATGGNVNFNENVKVSGNRLTNKGTGDNLDLLPVNRQFLFSTLFTQSGIIADGNIVVFENGLGNELNEHDAEKIINPGENFGISRNGILLSVEAHDEIAMSDTIFFHLQNLKQQPYQFRFAPVNITAGITAFLIDRYNNSSIAVNLTDSSFIDFAIGPDPGSYAADRFLLVFRQSVVVPVFIVDIDATRNPDQSNLVSWVVNNETNLQEYVIERSANGTDFESIGSTLPTANNGGTAGYRYRDANALSDVNFYRIRAISSNGRIQYSSIVKVEPGDMAASIAVSPNPAEGKMINIVFKNQQNGNYSLTLINKIGQLIYKDALHITHSNVVKTIQPLNELASGTYQLNILKEDGSKLTVQVVVK